MLEEPSRVREDRVSFRAPLVVHYHEDASFDDLRSAVLCNSNPIGNSVLTDCPRDGALFVFSARP